MVFSCVWQVLCSCLGGKEKWREDFLGLTTNDKWFVFPAIFDGQRVQINSLEILRCFGCRGVSKVAVGRCWKLSGIQKQREFPTSKGAHMPYKVPTNQ